MRLRIRPIGIWLAVAAICWFSIALAQSPANSDLNVTGTWKGTRTATGGVNRDYRIRSMKLDITQSGETLSGSYQCYAGKKATADCNNPVGRITAGTINGDAVKIDVQAMPNSLNCTFTGSVAEAKMKGKYTCYAGGSLSSVGVWKATKQ
jgi:hypothetical protein